MKGYWKWIFGAVAVLFILAAWNGRNGQINADEDVIEAAGNVEASYQRRADLIPNLVNVVKGYAAHESEVLTAVTEARQQVNNVQIDLKNATPAQLAQFQEAQAGLSSALSRLLVTVERYPDLKADQQFLNLQHELAGTENRINIARRDYNESVAACNKKVRMGFGPLWAIISGVDKRNAFEADPGAENAPAVSFE